MALASKARDHYVEWLQQYEQALLRLVDIEELMSAASGKNVKIARVIVRLLIVHRQVKLPIMLDLLLKRNDDVILADQIIPLIGQLPADERDARYRAAATSQFGGVRTDAMNILLGASDGAENDVDMAVAALSDPQSSVRFIATQFMHERGFDVRAHYRNILCDPGTPANGMRISLTALAGLRHQDDLDFVKSFAKHRAVMVRMAALAAWFKLAESDKDMIALTPLNDAAPRLIKFGLELVRKRGAYIPLTAIQTRLMDKLHVPLLLEFTAYSKWDYLESLARLSLACDLAEAQALGLGAPLLRWCQRCRWGWVERTEQAQFRFLSSQLAVGALQRLLPKEHDLGPYLRQELLR